MKTMNFKMAAMLAGAAVFALTSVAQAAPNNRAGASRASAKSSVNHGGGGGGKHAGGGNHAGGGKGSKGGNNNRGGNNNVNINKNNNVNVNTSGRNGYNNRGNTVVVAPGRGGYNNGYNNGWDNDDNDFLEFVGKTAAVTAGVSVVAAVIGSTTNDKPDDCQQSVSNGQVYMYCNGTWYQPIQSGSQTQYQVIAPPR